MSNNTPLPSAIILVRLQLLNDTRIMYLMDQDTLNKKIRLLKICVELIKKYKLIKGFSVIYLMVYK